jgi:hypothetical protein
MALPPVRLGPTTDHLTADDVAQIDGICSEGGKTPWLLIGQSPGMINRDRWYVTAYLYADRTATGVRHGRVCWVSAKLPAEGTYTASRTWERDSVPRVWAQVPMPGSNPDEIRGSRDLNRPFYTTDTLNDDTLVAIVALIRTGPVIAPPSSAPAGQPVPRGWTHVESTWPIQSIADGIQAKMSGSEAVVRLLGPELEERTGQTVELRLIEGKWAITGLGRWVVD